MDATVTPMVSLVAVALAMLGFAGVVLAGAFILRRLGIATEPPEMYRFEPPSPPLDTGVPDKQQASLRAQQRRDLMPIYNQAQAAYMAWGQMVDGLHSIEGGLESLLDSPDSKQVRSRVAHWRRRLSSLKDDLEAQLPDLAVSESARKAMSQTHDAMKGLYVEIEALWLAQGHDTSSRRRMLLLVLFLVIVVIWAYIMFALGAA